MTRQMTTTALRAGLLAGCAMLATSAQAQSARGFEVSGEIADYSYEERFDGDRIEDDGAITPEIGPFEPGRSVLLRVEMDLMLVIANCPHVMDPRDTWTVSPLRVTAWRGPITPEDDPVRNATPEGLRAYLNVEDYYRR